MARRAKRATNAELASYNASIQKSITKEIEKDINRTIARSVQNAAIEISNSLVEAGPVWSGRFASSWYMENVGSLGGPRVEGSIYKYSAKDFRVTSIERALKLGVSSFGLVNTAPHAGIALDGEYAIYRHPSDSEPLKNPVEFGFRPMDSSGEQTPSLRPDISMGYDNGSKPNAMITAEADWFVTYGLGGGLNRDLSRGVTIGFNGTRGA